MSSELLEDGPPKLDWEPSVRYASKWFVVVADYYDTIEDLKRAFKAGQVYMQDLMPDQVFSQKQLSEWAEAKGYTLIKKP